MTVADIRTQNLRRDFFMGDQVVHALDGVDIVVNEGDFLAVMGPSGSGKSTLLYLLGGLDRPTAGEIWVSGRDIAQLDENALATYRGQEVGFIFQAFHLVPTMTALQNVEFPMIFNRISPAERRTRAIALLERVGLEERMAHRPTELSGGQQQRVAIARALANDPRIILADEPTGNLDTHTGQEVLDLLTRLNREEGRTIVIVSHDVSVTRFATHDIHLLDGKVQSSNVGQ